MLCPKEKGAWVGLYTGRDLLGSQKGLPLIPLGAILVLLHSPVLGQTVPGGGGSV